MGKRVFTALITVFGIYNYSNVEDLRLIEEHRLMHSHKVFYFTVVKKRVKLMIEAYTLYSDIIKDLKIIAVMFDS